MTIPKREVKEHENKILKKNISSEMNCVGIRMQSLILFKPFFEFFYYFFFSNS